MASYQELKAQAEELLAQAEVLRKEEIAQVVADIKSQMQSYGLTAEDLGFSSSRGKGARKGGRMHVLPARYRGPNGETWAGGRGRKPEWVSKALASGRKLEEFAVK